MKVKIFVGSGTNVAEKDLLKSFGQGVEDWCNSKYSNEESSQNIVRIGRWSTAIPSPEHSVDYEYQESFTPCDVGVIFGSWKPREKGTHQCRTSVAYSGKPFVVIETPLLNRKTDSENTYWRVGINGYLNRDALWATMTDEDADKRLEEFGIKWNGWKNNPDGHIVLALQLPGDASLRGIDINDWAYRSIAQIRQRTDKKIIVRNHPLASQRAMNDHGELAFKIISAGIDNVQFSDGSLVPWSQDLENAYCTVTYSSGLGIDSVLAGIPTIACDPGNFAYGISSKTPKDINSVKQVDEDVITPWLRKLASCQWSEEEMLSGTAWKYLYPVLENIK